MRQIGHIEGEASAHLFGDFLYVQGVENQIELEAGHGWAVWIHSEEDLERANRLLGEFRAEPAHPRFQAQAKGAAEARAQAQAEQKAYASKIIKGRQIFSQLQNYGVGPLSLILIAASVVVFFLTRFGREPERMMYLFMTNWGEAGRYIQWAAGFPEMRHGEVWRLFTPIFLHFSFPHLVFNLVALRDLGSMIEARRSPLFFLLLVLALAAVSNTAQYFWHGPVFGGISGVVYGLFGYVWMQGKYNPASGLFLHQTTVVILFIQFVLCLVGFIPNVANAAHTAGLVMGVTWGFLEARRR